MEIRAAPPGLTGGGVSARSSTGVSSSASGSRAASAWGGAASAGGGATSAGGGPVSAGEDAGSSGNDSSVASSERFFARETFSRLGWSGIAAPVWQAMRW